MVAHSLAPANSRVCAVGGVAGGDGAGRKHRLGLVGFPARVVLCHRLEGRARLGNQRRHPVMVGEPDPAVAGDLRDLGAGAFAVVVVEIGHVGIAGLGQFAIGHGDHALVENEEVLEVRRLAVARQDAVGRQRRCLRAGVLDALGDREHEVLVDRDLAPEHQPGAVVPHQGDRAVGGQDIAAFQPPLGVGAGHVVEGDTPAPGAQP